MKTVTMHGEMWARNLANINLIPSSKKPGGQGVYILYDVSMPVYVGKGDMRSRIKSARLGKRRGQLWDHFSWYSLNPQIIHDIEALIYACCRRTFGHLRNKRQISGSEKSQRAAR
jgi:hypothetical protein